MRVKLTLQQLEAFSQVANTGGFRAAAQALHVSQPALSRTIKVLEDAIGARLFDRDTRHVQITPPGGELTLPRFHLQQFMQPRATPRHGLGCSTRPRSEVVGDRNILLFSQRYPPTEPGLTFRNVSNRRAQPSSEAS